jgi:hypothetical protein
LEVQRQDGSAEREEEQRREKQQLTEEEFKKLTEEQKSETPLEALCAGEYSLLARCFVFMKVNHLKGYTKEDLMSEIERQQGPRMLVPPWLVEYGLEQFLRGAGEWVLFTCSFPQYAADITRTALPHHGLATSGEPGEQPRQPLFCFLAIPPFCVAPLRCCAA